MNIVDTSKNVLIQGAIIKWNEKHPNDKINPQTYYELGSRLCLDYNSAVGWVVEEMGFRDRIFSRATKLLKDHVMPHLFGEGRLLQQSNRNLAERLRKLWNDAFDEICPLDIAENPVSVVMQNVPTGYPLSRLRQKIGKVIRIELFPFPILNKTKSEWPCRYPACAICLVITHKSQATRYFLNYIAREYGKGSKNYYLGNPENNNSNPKDLSRFTGKGDDPISECLEPYGFVQTQENVVAIDGAQNGLMGIIQEEEDGFYRERAYQGASIEGAVDITGGVIAIPEDPQVIDKVAEEFDRYANFTAEGLETHELMLPAGILDIIAGYAAYEGNS